MASSVRASVKGMDRVLKRVAELGRRYQDAVGAGVYGLGEEILTDSKQRVPVDYGFLKGSGYVTLPVELVGSMRVEIGYGGPAKEYAVHVHERTEVNHPDGGEAKYLENAINAASSGARARVADLAMRAFRENSKARRGASPTGPNEGEG